MRNNIVTASRMTTLLRCMRAHYWQYEVGLRKISGGLALRVGSAWHRGLEARWNGADYEGALAAAIPEGIDLDGYACATLAALLAAYFDYWQSRESVAKIHPEVQFKFDLIDGFTVEGKIDGLGSLVDGRSVLVESKSTSDSVAPDSEYWLRLAFNLQIYQYVLACRGIGWDIAEVVYDVMRKPSIRPKEVDNLDSNGKKIVEDAAGKRIFLQAGKNKGEPRQTGDSEKGYTVKSHRETPEEFSDRLYKDAMSRPEFYFARREVPILDSQIDQFERQRESLTRLIVELRRAESLVEKPEDAWPRAVTEQNCSFCAFKDFCLQNISINPAQPPAGFEVKLNPELEQDNDATITETSDTSAAG